MSPCLYIIGAGMNIRTKQKGERIFTADRKSDGVLGRVLSTLSRKGHHNSSMTGGPRGGGCAIPHYMIPSSWPLDVVLCVVRYVGRVLLYENSNGEADVKDIISI